MGLSSIKFGQNKVKKYVPIWLIGNCLWKSTGERWSVDAETLLHDRSRVEDGLCVSRFGRRKLKQLHYLTRTGYCCCSWIFCLIFLLVLCKGLNVQWRCGEILVLQ